MMSDGDEMPAVESIYVHPAAQPPRCAKCSRVEMLLAKIDDKREHCVSFDLVPTLDRLRWLGDVDEATRANVIRDELDLALDYQRARGTAHPPEPKLIACIRETMRRNGIHDWDCQRGPPESETAPGKGAVSEGRDKGESQRDISAEGGGRA